MSAPRPTAWRALCATAAVAALCAWAVVKAVLHVADALSGRR